MRRTFIAFVAGQVAAVFARVVTGPSQAWPSAARSQGLASITPAEEPPEPAIGTRTIDESEWDKLLAAHMEEIAEAARHQWRH